MTVHDQLDLWAADPPAPALLTVRDVGRLLSISRSSVYELIANRRLETVHIGRSVRIPSDSVSAYVRSLRSGSGG